MTDRWTDRMTEGRNDRQPKSNIAPTFLKRGYNEKKQIYILSNSIPFLKKTV